MGKLRLVEKKVLPLTTMTSLTPQLVTNRDRGGLGVLPIGVYKGVAAFWDLDKAVNQPLVNSEKQHILGILNGGTEGRDLVTVELADTTAAGVSTRGRLTVPTGQVWFVHAVVIAHDASLTTGEFDYNWRCSLWPSLEDPADADGQPFHATAKEAAAVAGGQVDLFYTGAIGTGWGEAALDTDELILNNKDVPLRLPGGSVITLTTLITTVLDAAIDVTLQLYGYVGKSLVA